MKIAAILIPLIILMLPNLLSIGLAIKASLRGEEIQGKGYYPTKNQLRKYYAIAIAYFALFALSIAWAIYVFTDNLAIAIVIAILPPVFIGGMILIIRITGPQIPRPTPGSRLDTKSQLERENMIADQQMKMFRSKKYWGMILIFAVVVQGIVIIATILFTGD